MVSQWVWNLRLELGHQLHPDPVRTTEFASAIPPSSPYVAPSTGYAPPHMGVSWKAGRFAGQDFVLQPDGTLRCPNDQKLIPHEQRREADGSLRVVYGASIRSCRPCPLREQCQWNGSATAKPRQVSVRLASARRRLCPTVLALLPPQSPPARLHATCAPPTHRGQPVASHRHCATHSGSDPLPGRARACAALLGRALRAQRASPGRGPGRD